MEPNALQQALEKLKSTVHRLALESLDRVGDPAKRAQERTALEQELQALRPEMDALPTDQRSSLARIWQSIKSDLLFLKSEEPVPAPPSAEVGDLLERVRHINEQAYGLAKTCALHQDDQQTLAAQARQLHAELMGLAGELNHAAPEVTQLLSEANLDLLFVLSEGKAPTSLRLHHFLGSG